MLERPNTQFAIYRSPTVGDNQAGGIGAMVLAGSRIRGVIVDNPSGSWVKLSGTGLGFEPFIAPYTLAWSVSLLPSVLEISAAYVAGPTGQMASTAGSPIVVYLFEAQVPSSGGSTFVNRSDEAAYINQSLVAVVAVTNVPNWLVLPSPSTRFRVLHVGVRHNSDMQLSVTLVDQVSNAQFGLLAAPPERGRDEIDYPGGLDLSIGAPIRLAYQSVWGSVPFDIDLQYVIV